MKTLLIIISLFSSIFGYLPIPNKWTDVNVYKKYPISPHNNAWYIQKLGSRNITAMNDMYNPNPRKYNKNIPNFDDDDEEDEEEDIIGALLRNITSNLNSKESSDSPVPGVRIVLSKNVIHKLSKQIEGSYQPENDEDDDDEKDIWGRPIRSTLKKAKSDNFEVIRKSGFKFKDVGGYDNIKQELFQCVDLLSNFTKYSTYNIRIPKGLILEGPPGNGKTLIAKALAGEAKTSFICVSGSEFQDKYVGVGSGRIRELFTLAKSNLPCIIFIDEIDALGRKRSGDGETAGSERDNTLNELLVALDGFKNTSGVFVIGATNRADLLDSALMRPGRIDKRIFIGNPDKITRKAILDIHSKGKPHDNSVIFENLVDLTNGLSGAQIENLLNEAMLNALRFNREVFGMDDIDIVLNKMMVGWQPSEHQYSDNMIEQIAIHEMGHAVVGLLSKHHAKMKKVVINFSSPKTPAYTIFESSASSILTREALFEHLMILLAGRIAEEVFYGVSVSTGAINDFEEALKLAEKMVCYYGMGKQLIYPSMSEKYKEIIDTEVAAIINNAYGYAEFIVRNSKDLITEGASILKNDKVLTADNMLRLMNEKYLSVLNLKI
jgi:cell division protease FtsH